MNNPRPLFASNKNDYRPDIDGLRAIAVLSVLCFHAFPSLLQGGFVGVDIFFVISGYLISKHIWEELAAGTYSLKTFYARRVRRIFPALTFVLAACLGMGWIILSPNEYEQLGKHVTAGSLFVSNLVFWKEAGYFDNAADTKPLLHLWSLGIEEQFYIVWPLLLAFFWRNTRYFVIGFLLLFSISLLYSISLVQHDAVADFYSPLTRFWELAIGASTAYLRTRNYALSDVQRNQIAWSGLLLIALSVTLVEKTYLFPGAWALLPTLGAASLILAGEPAMLNRKFLSHPVLVWVGLISYPLYLWHWPLLSFARIMESGVPSASLRVTLLSLSVFLAWLTYRFIERPTRLSPRAKSVVIVLCVAMLVLAVTGETIRKLSGIETRKMTMLNGDPASLVLGADRNKLQHECGLAEAQNPLFQYCLSSGLNPQFALLGDSKAEALLYGLVRESKPDMHWSMIGSVSPSFTSDRISEQQISKNKLAFQAVQKSESIKTVIWVLSIHGLFSLDAETGFIVEKQLPEEQVTAYSSAIRSLEHAGKRVIFVIDNPTFPDPKSCISGGVTNSPWLNQFLRRKENPHCQTRYTDYLNGMSLYWQFAEKLQRVNPNLIVYNPTDLLCDVAENNCSVVKNGKFLYSYGNHISDYANSMIAKDMLANISTLH
jgi:peptidoglycan/LPS O-acetylase OafA/YrhL